MCFGTNYDRYVNIIRNQFKNLEELNSVKIIGKTSYVTDYFIDLLNLGQERAKQVFITPVSNPHVQQFDLSNHPQLAPSLQMQKCSEIQYLNVQNEIGF